MPYHHLDFAQPEDQGRPGHDHTATPYVPLGDKDAYHPDSADDAAELRLIRGYADRKPVKD